MQTWKRCTLGLGIARLFCAVSWASLGGSNRELLSKIHGKIVKENNNKNYFLLPKKSSTCFDLNRAVRVHAVLIFSPF
jgi:hypothetical protein